MELYLALKCIFVFKYSLLYTRSGSPNLWFLCRDLVFATRPIGAGIRRVAQPIRMQNSAHTVDDVQYL